MEGISEEFIDALEQRLLKRSLTSLEKFILTQSWLGQNYDEIAKNAGYSLDYMKQIGSVLWSDLSQATGKTVTKKNLKVTLEPLLPEFVSVSSSGAHPEPAEANAPPVSASDTFAPTPPRPLTRRFPSGPVPLDSTLYIERPPLERIAYDELQQPGCLLRIKAPRRMGKSSLLNRLVAYAQKQDSRVITVDCQQISEELLESTEQFLRWFCRYLTQSLNLDDTVEADWDIGMGSKVNCTHYLEKKVLGQLNTSVVLTINESNRLFEYPAIARSFLPLLRFWHEQSKDNPVWQRFRLILVYSTDIYTPLQLKQSPFNVGTPIRLPPFNANQFQQLSVRYGLDWQERQPSELALLHKMIDGHPYLANLAFYYLQQGDLSLSELLAQASTSNGIYRNHLQELLVMLQEDPELAAAFRAIVEDEAGAVVDAITTHKLEGMGLVLLRDGKVHPICKLYRLYFREQLQAISP